MIIYTNEGPLNVYIDGGVLTTEEPVTLEETLPVEETRENLGEDTGSSDY